MFFYMVLEINSISLNHINLKQRHINKSYRLLVYNTSNNNHGKDWFFYAFVRYEKINLF